MFVMRLAEFLPGEDAGVVLTVAASIS